MIQDNSDSPGAWQTVFLEIQGSKEDQLKQLGHDLQRLKDLSPEERQTTLATLRDQIRKKLFDLVNDQLITPRLLGHVLSLKGLEGMRQEEAIIYAVRTTLADLMINEPDKAEAVAQANALMADRLCSKEEIESAALESIQFYFDQKKINLEEAEVIRKSFGIDPQKIYEAFKDYSEEILKSYQSSDNSMELSDVTQWIPEDLVRKEGLERLKRVFRESGHRGEIEMKEIVRKYDLKGAHCGSAFDSLYDERGWGEYLKSLPDSLSSIPERRVEVDLEKLEELEKILSSLGVDETNSASLASFRKIMDIFREWLKPHAQLENALGHVGTLEKAIKGFGLSEAEKPLAQLREILESHRKSLKS